MNYRHWLAKKNPNANKDVLYLLINNEHETFTKFEINIDSSQGQELQIARAFCNRQEKLKALKEAIINDELHGIFGGMSHRERNAAQRKYTKQGLTLDEWINQDGKYGQT